MLLEFLCSTCGAKQRSCFHKQIGSRMHGHSGFVSRDFVLTVGERGLGAAVVRAHPEINVVFLVLPVGVAFVALILHDEVLAEVVHVHEGARSKLLLVSGKGDGVVVGALPLCRLVVVRRVSTILGESYLSTGR